MLIHRNFLAKTMVDISNAANRGKVLSVGGVFILVEGFILGYRFQIQFWIAVENQIGIGQRVVVDEIIQFRALVHIVGYFVLHGDGVDGANAPV